MKIGLYYEDIRTGEILKCINFTRSAYLFENSRGELVDVRVKTNHYKRVVSKKKIAEFEGKFIKPTTIDINQNNWEYIQRLMKATGYKSFNDYFNEEIMELVVGCLDPDANYELRPVANAKII